MKRYYIDKRFSLLFDSDKVFLTEKGNIVITLSKEDVGGLLVSGGIVRIEKNIVFCLFYEEYSGKIEITIFSDKDYKFVYSDAEDLIEYLWEVKNDNL